MEREQGVVSVIIPTYYRNEGLLDAIESVHEQTYDDIEIVIVDDSGEGYAKPAVRDLDVIYVEKQENEGLIEAWNTGFEYTTGEFIQLLDDDDKLIQEKICSQVKKFENQPGIGVIHCGIQWDFGVAISPDPSMRGSVLENVLTLDTSPCVTSTMLIRSSEFNEVHPLPAYQAASDDVLKIELAQRTQFDYVDRCMLIRGTGDENLSTSMKPILAGKEILKDYNQLYESIDEDVRRQAMAKLSERKGFAHLDKTWWSFKSTKSFYNAFRVHPSPNVKLLVLVMLSLGGKPMLSIADEVTKGVKSVRS